MTSDAFEDYPIVPGIRQRTIDNVNGMSVRILEAGFESPDRPVVLLLHGFPDLAWSWREVLPALARAGYHAIAPDQRGYGGTTGWDGRYDGDYAMFRTHSYALDAMRLVFALGHRSVAAVVGHDFGSMIAAYCALVRPDVFRSLVMVSFPFDGPPTIPSAMLASRQSPRNRRSLLSSRRWPAPARTAWPSSRRRAPPQICSMRRRDCTTF